MGIFGIKCKVPGCVHYIPPHVHIVGNECWVHEHPELEQAKVMITPADLTVRRE